MRKVGVVGLGKLGLPLAACLAYKGNDVVGVDIDQCRVDLVNRGKSPIYEPGLQDLLGRRGLSLEATSDFRSIVGASVVFVVVNTPSKEDGSYSLGQVLSAARRVGEAIEGAKEYQVVALVSTVMPGDVEGHLKPALERASGKRCGEDFGLCYSPEFIALGNVIRGLLSPDFVLIGEYDKRSGDVVEEVYREMCENSPPIERMSIVNAEITKISLNSYITMKMTFANILADMCERYEGGDVDVVTRALGRDRRIAPSYLKGALAYGGPCLLPSALIQTSKGLRRIDSIRVGELVLSHDGKYHKVTKIFKRGFKGELLRITPEGFPKSPIIVTPEHPIWAGKRKSNSRERYRMVSTGKKRLNYMTSHSAIDFIPASQLEAGDILALPSLDLETKNDFTVNLRTHHLSPVKDSIPLTPELMWLFGFYLSEGSTWKKEIKFSFNSNEKHYVDDISELISDHFGVKTRIRENTETILNTRTTCSPLADYFRSTFGFHAREKRIPYEWLGLPNGYLTELLRGLWYGDGSKSDNVFTFGTVSRELFNFMKLLMLKFQIAFSTKEYEEHTDKWGVHHQKAYHLRVCNPPYMKKMNLVLPDLRIDLEGNGKKTIWFEDGKMLYHIRKRDAVPYKGEVYNLEVEDSNSYMLEGAVVHNCFPRDNRAFCLSAKRVGCEAKFPLVTDELNERQNERVASLILKELGNRDRKVAFLGLSYKPETDVIEESAPVKIIRRLLQSGVRVTVYDPAAMAAAREVLGALVEYSGSVEECVKDADLCVIATPWEDFLEFPSILARSNRHDLTIVDCWRILRNKVAQLPSRCKYIGLGLFREPE